MFLIFFIWIYDEINKNLYVKAIFVNFITYRSCELDGQSKWTGL